MSGAIKVVSVNVGAIAPLFANQAGNPRRIMSGIHKHSVAGAVSLGRLGLAADEQADPSVHGGLDKAVYAYPCEHYAFWEAQRLAVFKQASPLEYGAIGENLTVAGLLETDVWIGDRLHIGDAVLQVTEPRQPCFKFNAKMGLPQAAKLMVQGGLTGFYLRVLQEGALRAGAEIVLVAGARQVSVAQMNAQRRRGRQRDLFD